VPQLAAELKASGVVAELEVEAGGQASPSASQLLCVSVPADLAAEHYPATWCCKAACLHACFLLAPCCVRPCLAMVGCQVPPVDFELGLSLAFLFTGLQTGGRLCSGWQQLCRRELGCSTGRPRCCQPMLMTSGVRPELEQEGGRWGLPVVAFWLTWLACCSCATPPTAWHAPGVLVAAVLCCAVLCCAASTQGMIGNVATWPVLRCPATPAPLQM
jgi:hypothetical protein